MCWKHFTVFQSEYEGPRSEGIHAVCFQTPFGKILIDDIQEMQKKVEFAKLTKRKTQWQRHCGEWFALLPRLTPSLTNFNKDERMDVEVNEEWCGSRARHWSALLLYCWTSRKSKGGKCLPDWVYKLRLKSGHLIQKNKQLK